MILHTKDTKGNPHQRPATMAFQGQNIPPELQKLDQWISWSWTWNGKKWDKVPYKVGGGRATSTNPKTWSTYNRAIEYVRNFELNSPQAHRGMGLVFTAEDEFVGIDLDKCRDPETGLITEEAWGIVNRFSSYAEISPSGTGVKIWVKGKIPEWSKKANHEAGVEIFEASKYYAMTGWIIPGMPSACIECQEQIEWLCQKYLKSESAKKKTTEPREYKPRHQLADAFETEEDLLSALEALSTSRADCYTDWLNVGMALHNHDQGLLHEWDRWSAQSSCYEPGKCQEKWESFTQGGGLGIGSIFEWAKQDGWIRPFRRDPNTRPESGSLRLDATRWAPLEEFAGETVFLPDMLTKQETGDAESHTAACSCDSCSAKARTEEARDRETRKSCRTNFFLTNGDNTFFARLPCMNWGCDACRKNKLIPKWQKHLEYVISGEESVHVGIVDHADWHKVTRRIRRRQGEYTRILSHENGVLVIASVKFTGSQELGQETAIARVREWTEDLAENPPGLKAKKKWERPFSTSNAWKPVKEPPKDSEYKRIDMPRAADKTIKKALAEYRIKFETLERAGSGQVTFARLELPPEFYGSTQELLKNVAARVASIVNPENEWSRDHTAPQSPNVFVAKNSFEESHGSLSNYPQDPLFASPPDF